MVMDELKKKIFAGVTGTIGAFLKAYGVILACVCVAIVFDVITGLIASKACGEPITRERGNKGYWKKLGLLAGLAFGIFLDVFIPMILSYISISIPFNMPFGLIIGAYITINEAISICVNLNKSNPDMLPAWIKSMLQGTKDKLESKGE